MAAELTAAILLGAADFPHIARFSNPAFRQSKADLKRYLLAPRPRGLGVPSSAVLDLFNSEADPGSQLGWIGEFLDKLHSSHPGHDALRNVIVHYVGHGYHFAGGRELFLALAQSHEKPGAGEATALRAAWLTRTLNAQAKRFRFFYLLDCCFAGKVLRDGQGGVDEALVSALRVDQGPRHGSAALCATTPDDWAMAPKERSSAAAQRTRGRTVFSDALLEVLSRGDPDLGERITLAQVYDLVGGHIQRKHAGEPDYQVRPYLDSPDQNDLAHRAALFPNPAFERTWQTADQDTELVRARSTADLPGADLLPKPLRSRLDHLDPEVRLPGVAELARVLAEGSAALKAAALRALEWLKGDADVRVSHNATSALTSALSAPLSSSPLSSSPRNGVHGLHGLQGPAAGQVLRDTPDGPEMIVIPPGRFLMGSPPNEPGRSADEGPQHEVTIAYCLAVAKHPVTRGDWRRYLAETGREASHNAWGFNRHTGAFEQREGYCWSSPGFEQEDSHPVVCVTWQEATEYAVWLSAKTGHRYRLLSEAEYEYVNRAGTSGAYWWGESADLQSRYANGADAALKARHNYEHWTYAPGNDGFVYTSPVGRFPANPFGLHDVTGNVMCWTQDRWHAGYEGAPSDGSAWESGSDPRRVVHGGSWSTAPRGLRCAFRARLGNSYSCLGFRLARIV